MIKICKCKSWLILILWLIFSSNNALAGWIGIGRAKDGMGKFYLDSSTIKRNGNKVTVWVLTDFKHPQNTIAGLKSYSSYKWKLEADCRKSESRYLGFDVFSNSMGRGTVLLTNDDALESRPIPVGSIIKVISEYACKKAIKISR